MADTIDRPGTPMHGAGQAGLRLNIGCGRTPTRGWRNFDNSPSVRLAGSPLLVRVLDLLKLLDAGQRSYVEFARTAGIEFADATRRIPLPAGCAGVVYSSHMIEHLDRAEAGLFLEEVHGVLVPGGILRLAAPDLGRQVDRYVADGDADALVASTHLALPRPRTLVQKLRVVLVGARHHQWMYDGRSLCSLLTHHGFIGASALEAGVNGIPDPGERDLSERSDASVHVEARKAGVGS